MGAIMNLEDVKKRELKKHIAAIRVSNNVGLLPRKSWNVLLLNAYDSLLKDKVHQIPVKVLSEVVGYNSESYDSLDNALKKLQSTLVEWDIGGGCEVKGKWIKNLKRTQMLGGVFIEDGIIHYDFHPLLAKELYNPAIFQRINLTQQREFSSSASLALWENCIRFIGVGTTGLSDIDEWRELLGATNKKAYSAFFRFNGKVITPAIKEINQKSNITIELITEKKGRRTIKMGFFVKEKAQKSLFSDRLEEVKASTEYQDLLSYGIHKVQALRWIDEYGYSYIREKIELLKKNKELGSIKNPSGFLVKSIEKDFQDSEIKEKEAQKQKQAEERAKLVAERKKREQEENRRIAERTVKKIYLEALSSEEKANLLEKMKADFPESSSILKSVEKGAGYAFLFNYIENYPEKVETELKK
jgi:plasmid replication initiation protein